MEVPQENFRAQSRWSVDTVDTRTLSPTSTISSLWHAPRFNPDGEDVEQLLLHGGYLPESEQEMPSPLAESHYKLQPEPAYQTQESKDAAEIEENLREAGLIPDNRSSTPRQNSRDDAATAADIESRLVESNLIPPKKHSSVSSISSVDSQATLVPENERTTNEADEADEEPTWMPYFFKRFQSFSGLAGLRGEDRVRRKSSVTPAKVKGNERRKRSSNEGLEPKREYTEAQDEYAEEIEANLRGMGLMKVEEKEPVPGHLVSKMSW